MKNTKSFIWGLILVTLGILLGVKQFVDIDIFFDGWWTLFIIVPSFINLFFDEDKTGSLIGVVIGVLLLLSMQDLFDFDILWKLLLPIIIVIIGLSMIFKNCFNKDLNDKIKKLNSSKNNDSECFAAFSGQKLNYSNQEFNGKTLSAIFGGIDMDLREAKINDDVVINTTSVFGGIDIFVPSNVKVVVKSNSIFGGVSNKKKNSVDDKSKTIYINATCLFGGVDIK